MLGLSPHLFCVYFYYAFQVSISKFVLQTFHVTDTFLQAVRHKSSIYPEDINLAKV